MIILFLLSFSFNIFLILRIRHKNMQLIELSDLYEKQKKLYGILNNIFRMRQKNISIARWLKEKGYTKIAIYGMHFVGQRLFDVLIEEDINIVYLIDQKKGGQYRDVKICAPSDKLEKVDALIITPVSYYNEIFIDMQKRIDCVILSVEDLLEEAG